MIFCPHHSPKIHVPSGGKKKWLDHIAHQPASQTAGPHPTNYHKATGNTKPPPSISNNQEGKNPFTPQLFPLSLSLSLFLLGSSFSLRSCLGASRRGRPQRVTYLPLIHSRIGTPCKCCRESCGVRFHRRDLLPFLIFLLIDCLNLGET